MGSKINTYTAFQASGPRSCAGLQKRAKAGSTPAPYLGYAISQCRQKRIERTFG